MSHPDANTSEKAETGVVWTLGKIVADPVLFKVLAIGMLVGNMSLFSVIFRIDDPEARTKELLGLLLFANFCLMTVEYTLLCRWLGQPYPWVGPTDTAGKLATVLILMLLIGSLAAAAYERITGYSERVFREEEAARQVDQEQYKSQVRNFDPVAMQQAFERVAQARAARDARTRPTTLPGNNRIEDDN